jgi:folylpolyglutamate synthase/dihydropteroate synthase
MVAEIPAALARARNLTTGADLVVITGSIYLVGEAMQVLGVEA